MKLNRPIPVYVNCVSVQQKFEWENTCNVTIRCVDGSEHELEVPMDILVESNKIVAEIHEIIEPDIFSLSTQGVAGGKSTYWLLNVDQSVLEFIEYKPYVGKLSP